MTFVHAQIIQGNSCSYPPYVVSARALTKRGDAQRCVAHRPSKFALENFIETFCTTPQGVSKFSTRRRAIRIVMFFISGTPRGDAQRCVAHRPTWLESADTCTCTAYCGYVLKVISPRIYIYVYVYMYIHVCIYTYIYRHIYISVEK